MPSNRAIRQHQHQQQPTPGGATSSHRAGASASHRFYGSYPDRTHTGRRRRACVRSGLQTTTSDDWAHSEDLCRERRDKRKRREKPAWSCCERERRRQDVVRDGGPADCGAVEVMEVVWPSGAALRGEASNRPQVHWLKTVVLNVVGKGAARSRQVGVGKMSDGRESSAVDVSKAGKTTSKPGLLLRPGMSLGGARLLPRRRPAYRQHDPDRGASMERVKACLDTAAVPSAARGRSPSGRIREELSTVAGCAGGLARSSCEASAYRSGSWSEGAGSSRRAGAVNRKG